jgi:tetratricopeptide (TPR) repeat protein
MRNRLLFALLTLALATPATVPGARAAEPAAGAPAASPSTPAVPPATSPTAAPTPATAMTTPAPATPAPLAAFSATLDQQWDYAKPAESEARFRAELAKWPPGDPQALVVQTQIARTQGLRRQFAEADATLDAVASKLDGAPSHVRVRYLLERGRVLNSSGKPERAMAPFAEALSLAECNGDAFYAVDAAHMLGIAAPAGERMEWNLKALAMAERASDARTRRWLASLHNNIGHTYLEAGNYVAALEHFQKALPAWEARGNAANVRFARWSVARAQRSLGELDAAERAQRALLAEYDRLGETDGYVYEELAEIALARGDAAAARPWAAKAHAALKDDPDLKANEPARLARLAAVAAGDAPARAGR